MAGTSTRTETFLFSDIEGSTRLLRRLGDAYSAVLEDHRRLLRAAFAAHGGEEQGTEGDSFFVVFSAATEAVAAAVDAQLALARESEQRNGVRVRIGVHTGEAMRTAGGYIGLAVHEAARICAVGHGGQVVVSEATRLVAEGLPPVVSFRALGEHRLKDFEAAVRLFQVCHPDLGDRFPPLRTLEMIPNNLSKALTAFVGRREELAELSALLVRTRLLTLTGPGGIGKTRLATELATSVAQEHAGGLWLAELASVTDPALVAGTVAAAAGLRSEAGRPPTEALAQWIGGGHLLLVLDNCEHVLDACGALVNTLLERCPALVIVATSREHLALQGEVTWLVPPLSVTTVTAGSLAEVAESDTGRLFLDRAHAARPSLDLTDADAATLADICHRLEGIPLAVELAAARVATMSLHQLAVRLDDRFRLLASERRGGPRRHQTLHAVVGWSYDLLGDTERLLFRRLAVLTGDFTAEAAEAVGTGPGLVTDDVLDVIGRLIDRSLVMLASSGGADYRMLDSIRDFASAELLASGELPATRRRLTTWCLRLAENASAELQGPEQARWIEVIAANHDAIRAALAFGLHGRSYRRAGRLAVAMGRFWLIRGHWDEGRAWFERALAEPADPAVRAPMLAHAAALAAVQGDDDESRTMGEEALSIAAGIGDRLSEIDAHFVLGVDRFSRRELDAATASFASALAASEIVRDGPRTAAALAALGSVAWARDDLAEARRLLRESLELRERIGDQHGAAVSLNNLSVLAMTEGDLDRVWALSERSLKISEALGDIEGIAASLHHMAEVAEARDHIDDAVALAEECLSLGRRLGDRRGVAMSRETLARLAVARGEHADARRWYRASLCTHVDLRDKAAIDALMPQLAHFAVADGRADVAAALEMTEGQRDSAVEAALAWLV